MPDDLSGSAAYSVGDVFGQVVQADTINGGVHIHHHPTPRPAVLPLRIGVVPPRAASFQERSADLTAPVTVLSGLGGVGKTQLAADHAERVWAAREVRLLIWVTAGSREAIVSSYADAAAQLTGQDDPDPERGARTLVEWLASANTPWLVVLDDLQAPGDLTGLWPPATGRVVVTTRRRDAALRGHQRQLVDVDVFTHQESLAYLWASLADQPSLLEGAQELAQGLGHLPLALAQAGAYLRDRHLTCALYLTRFTERKLAQVAPDELPDEHRTTLAATWSLSVELAEQLPPKRVARLLLSVASVLDPNGIPVDVFTTAAVQQALVPAAVRWVDEEEARDGLGCLHRLSLVTLNLDAPAREVRVHALVQRATREERSDRRVGRAVLAAADALLEIWPEIELDTALGEVLRTNSDALAEIAGDLLWEGGCHPVVFRAGRSRGERGLAAGARDYFDALRLTAIRMLGPDHSDTLAIRNNLAYWQGEAGDPAQAVTTFRHLVADCARVLGPDHHETLTTRHGFVDWLGKAGDIAGAVAAHQQLVTDCSRILGSGHRLTLTTRHNLAHWQGEAGDRTGAATALHQILTHRAQTLGSDHPDTLATRHNLAHQQGKAGDIAGAVTTFRHLVTDYARVLGPDHPTTLITRNNHAYWQGHAGDAAEATAAFQQLVTDCIRILGPDHSLTLTAETNRRVWEKRTP